MTMNDMEKLQPEKDAGPSGEIDKALESLNRVLGYNFKDPNALMEALSPDTPSFRQRASRGDRMLGFLLSEIMHRKFPDMGRNQREYALHYLVSNRILARQAEEIGLVQVLAKSPKGSARHEQELSLKTQRIRYGDTFEALLSVIYDQGGEDDVWLFVERIFSSVIDTAPASPKDEWKQFEYIAWSQGLNVVLVEKQIADSRFQCSIELDGEEYFTFTADNKSTALTKAIHGALYKLESSSAGLS